LKETKIDDSRKALVGCEELATEIEKEVSASVAESSRVKQLLAETEESRDKLTCQLAELQAQLVAAAQRYELEQRKLAESRLSDDERIKALLEEAQGAKDLLAKCEDLTHQRDDLIAKLKTAEERREDVERQLSGTQLDQDDHAKKLREEASDARRAYNESMCEFAALQERYTNLAQSLKQQEDMYADNQKELVKLKSALEKETMEVARLKDVENELRGKLGASEEAQEEAKVRAEQEKKAAEEAAVAKKKAEEEAAVAKEKAEEEAKVDLAKLSSETDLRRQLRQHHKAAAMCFASRRINLDAASLVDSCFLVWARSLARRARKDDSAEAEALEEQRRRHAEDLTLLRGEFDLSKQRFAEEEARMAREMLDKQAALAEAKQQAAWQAQLTEVKAKANEDLMAQLAAAQEQMNQVSQIQSLAEVSARVAESTHEENASVWQQMLQEAQRRFDAQLAETRAKAGQDLAEQQAQLVDLRAKLASDAREQVVALQAQLNRANIGMAEEQASCQARLEESHALAAQEATAAKAISCAELSEVRFEAAENRQRDQEEMMALRTRLSMLEAQQDDLVRLRVMDEQAKLQARLDATLANELRIRDELSESKADLDRAKAGSASQISKLELTLGKILEDKAKLQSQLDQARAALAEEAAQSNATLNASKEKLELLESEIEQLERIAAESTEQSQTSMSRTQEENSRLMSELQSALAAQAKGSESAEEVARLRQELQTRGDFAAEELVAAEAALQKLREEARLAEASCGEEKRIADTAEATAAHLRKEVATYKEELYRLQSDANAKAADDAANLEHLRKKASDAEVSAQKEFARLTESLQHYELEAARKNAGLDDSEQRSSALQSEVAELEAARDEQARLRAIADELAASLQNDVASESQELRDHMRQHAETRAHLESMEQDCEALSLKLQHHEELSLAARASMLKCSSEMVEARSEVQTLRSRLAQSSEDYEAIAADEAARLQRLREWAKLQRSGIGRRFEFALDRWIAAVSFAAWAHSVGVTRCNKFSQAAQLRANNAAEAAAMELRRAARSQEEAEHHRAEAERLRRELRELKAKMMEFERLKEVDIKLEIIDREQRIRDLLDQRPELQGQRPESLPRMMQTPESTQGAATPLGHTPRRETADQSRSISQNGGRLPPANHYGRAVEDARTIRPHTSMDTHSRTRTSASRTSMSPEGKCSSYMQQPMPPQRPPQQKTPRRGRKSSERSQRREPQDASSDMWAFVNFGQPLTDYVLNTDVPMPKPLRRFISPNDVAEVTKG